MTEEKTVLFGEAEISDNGPRCAECGHTTYDETRSPYRKTLGFVLDDSDEPPIVHERIVTGFLCDICTPFESPLIEGMVAALVERRFNAYEVREKLKMLNIEALWGLWCEPLLLTMEGTLGLEHR